MEKYSEEFEEEFSYFMCDYSIVLSEFLHPRFDIPHIFVLYSNNKYDENMVKDYIQEVIIPQAKTWVLEEKLSDLDNDFK